ncbi:MAG: hypothetical protein IK083_01315 [Abditibacteriota bacterium]|nr:hypothetical protein [Abditibacteriota bacterium]
MRYCLIIMLLFLYAPLLASQVTLRGTVGDQDLAYTGEEIDGEKAFSVKSNSIYVMITELYPYSPTKDCPAYSYTVDITGEAPFVRHFTGPGFGPVSYFIRLSSTAKNKKVTIRASGEVKPVISQVKGVSADDLAREKKRDSFIISGLIPPVSPNLEGLEPPVRELAESLPDLPEEYHISKGVSTEIRYANTPDNVLRDIADAFYLLHDKYSLKIIIGMVSWWSGTPRFVNDPEGLPFGDEKYQQICYSPDLKFPFSQKLSDLLGPRYNTHYTSTQPNQWANTPWLTMNSDALFEFRRDTLRKAFEILGGAADTTDWIDNVYMENEPKYFDMVLDRDGAYGERLWADFNPFAVAAAKKDGVELDPGDGLSEEELLWLHRNVSEYNTRSAGMYREIMQELGFGQDIYTHSLYQGRDVFPCNMLKGKPASEWAVSAKAFTGLESCTIPMLPSDIYRVREHGRWTNLNREENDGMPLTLHLYDLRLAYMMGADYYNSYNWHSIGQGAYAGYASDFAKGFPCPAEKPQDVKKQAADVLGICLPYGLLSFTELTVRTRPLERELTTTAALSDPDGNLIAQVPIKAEANTDTIRIVFPSMLECPMNKDLSLVIPGCDLLTEGVTVGIDLHEQRMLSRLIINNKVK